MNRVSKFAWTFLSKPSKIADVCRSKEGLNDGLRLFAVWLAASLLFSWVNPLQFLDANAPIAPQYGLGFWMHVACWEPIIFAMSIFFTIVTLEWLTTGTLQVKMASGGFWTAVPGLVGLYYVGHRSASDRSLYVAIIFAWLVPAVLIARKVVGHRWREVTIFMLGINALELVNLVLLFVLAPTKSYHAYIATIAISMIWVLAYSAISLKVLYGTSSARVVFAVLFALVVNATLPPIAFVLGLMPKEVLKIFMYG